MAHPIMLRPFEAFLHRLAPGADTSWLAGAAWSTVTTGKRGVSVACDAGAVPPPATQVIGSSGPYRVLRVDRVDDLQATGVVAAVSRPLAEAGIPIFNFSSWDACDTLVPADRLDEALDALMLAGYVVTESD